MKTTLLAVIFSTSLAAPLFADGTNVFNDDKSKMSYAVGMMFGHNLQQLGIDVDGGQLLRGIKDEQSGGATLLTPQEAQAAIKGFQEKIRAELAVKNLADGTAFLATNKNNPGIVTLPDGLQYKVITDGAGATPTADSLVTVNYRGAFLDGREFDNSAKLGHPAQLQLERIPLSGWREALTQMKVGSKWQLFIPSNLAYGVQGHPPAIPPNATLVFEVELLDAHNPSPAQTPAISSPASLTSDIIKVEGTNIQLIKQSDLEKLQSETKTN